VYLPCLESQSAADSRIAITFARHFHVGSPSSRHVNPCPSLHPESAAGRWT
jgi:hypothetical protein